MNILVLGLNYAPEQIGIGPYTAGLAEALAARGHHVEVIAGKPYYPDWRLHERHKGVERSEESRVTVWRCPFYVPARPSGARRIAHYLSFAAHALPLVWRRTNATRPDSVIAIAPALLAAPVALLTARRSGAASWLHIQDYEVEAALATGLLGEGFLSRLAQRFEAAILRRFDRVSTISSAMVAKAASKGVAPDRLVEIRNWAEIDAVHPAIDPAAMRRELGLSGTERIALYSGNLATKQGIGIIAEAAHLLAERHDIRFVVCGEGSGRDDFARLVEALPNVTLLPLQPRERLGELLTLAEVHLLPQIAGAADLVLPSKLTNMLASGRPVAATAAEGTALFDEVDGCGICVPPGDAAALAGAVVRLIDDAALSARLGTAARQRAEERWSRGGILARFTDLIDAAAHAKRPAMRKVQP